LRQGGRDQAEECRLVKATVIDVETEQLHEVLRLGVELGQDKGQVAHGVPGLHRQVAGIADLARRRQVDLPTHPDHLAAAHPVFVRDLDGPVPMPFRPSVTLLHDKPPSTIRDGEV
jgi:hypothetical protein